MLFGKTLGDYREYIKGKLSIPRDQDNLEWTNDDIDDAVHSARQEFWNRGQYQNKKGVKYANSVANTADVSVPTDVETIAYVRYYNGTSRQVLDYIELEAYLELTRTTQTGFPLYWTRNGGTISLCPRPATSVANGVEFWGKINLTQLTESTDIDTNIEARYFNTVCDYALGELWYKAEQEAKGDRYFAKFEKRMDDIMFELLSDQTGQNIWNGTEVGFIDELDDRRLGTLT